MRDLAIIVVRRTNDLSGIARALDDNFPAGIQLARLCTAIPWARRPGSVARDHVPSTGGEQRDITCQQLARTLSGYPHPAIAGGHCMKCGAGCLGEPPAPGCVHA